MNKLLMTLASVCLAAGCTTKLQRGEADAATQLCANNAYEVTVDSWCGNGCDSYPVSHKMRDTRPENQRVELNGMQPSPRCVSQ